jgi:hypothetical protein
MLTILEVLIRNENKMMRDIPEEQWRAERPPSVEAAEAIEYCLQAIFSDTKKRAKDIVVNGIDFETLIGTLLLAQDVVMEHEDCYYD